MILTAHCRDDMDVPPVMIQASDDDGYDVVSRKIVQDLRDRHLYGENDMIRVPEASYHV